MKALFIKILCLTLAAAALIPFICAVASAANDISLAASVQDTAGETEPEKKEEAPKKNQKLEEFKAKFKLNFITGKRYMYLIDGLKNTMIITVFAVLLGVFLGFICASVRYTYEEIVSEKERGFGSLVLTFFNKIVKLYLTVIRGTPVVVQLMIIYFGIFAAVKVSKTGVAIIAFGINSGAYVAEIVRSGLSSVDRGQLEAGRSLGLSYLSTISKIIIPQAFRNILPALGNELIVLLKETSVAGYIALNDLTRGGDTIRGVTYNSMPLYAVALVYLIVVMILSRFVTKLENHLKKDRAAPKRASRSGR